ncbi:single-stranded DNA-binding protein [Bacillus benzoevorans]|nr:single-stranded DNA-binding protein [Bacillus benzoevorans]
MINQVTLVGRLTKNPDLRLTPDGLSVASITLAVNRQYRNQQGEIDADFVQCKLWRKAAENTAKYCQKGSLVGVTGRIQTRNYNNSEGRRIYVTEVVAETIRFLGTKRSDDIIHHVEPVSVMETVQEQNDVRLQEN